MPGQIGPCGLILAATATGPHASTVPVVLIALAAAVAWAARVWWWPFAKCRRCDGTGKNAGSTGKRWGSCRRCKGTGKRQRLGSKAVRRAVSGLTRKGR